MTSVVALFSYQTRLNSLTSKTFTNIYQRNYRVILINLDNVIDRSWEKISLDRHFKERIWKDHMKFL